MDAIAELRTYGEYAGFSERLRDLGFKEDLSEELQSVAGVATT